MRKSYRVHFEHKAAIIFRHGSQGGSATGHSAVVRDHREEEIKTKAREAGAEPCSGVFARWQASGPENRLRKGTTRENGARTR